MDRADGSSSSAILYFFDIFLLDLCLAYNSNTLASSGEVNWERIALVLVLFLRVLENDFWNRSLDLDRVLGSVVLPIAVPPLDGSREGTVRVPPATDSSDLSSSL